MAKTNRRYTSPLDKLLMRFDAKHSPSAAQKAEIEKMRAIHERRDHAKAATNHGDTWEGF